MNELQVYARPRFLQTRKEHLGGISHGLCVVEIVREVFRRADVIEPLQRGTIVQINGEFVPKEYWGAIRPSAASEVVVTVGVHGGGGGKNPLAMIMSLAVIVAAPYLGSLLGTSLALGVMGGGVATASQVALASGLITGFVGIAGFLAVNAMFPTRSKLTATQTYVDSPIYSISGARNDARKFQPIPVILGKRRQVPPLGVMTYTELVGNDEYLRMCVVWGYGRLKIEDIKIGETPIGDFEDVEIETREGTATDAPLTLISSPILQDPVGVILTNADGWVVRRSRTNANELSVDIACLKGLTCFTSNGGRSERTVVVELRYREVGATDWTNLDPFTLTDKFVGALRRGRRWKVPHAGDYEIALRRVTADNTSDQIVDEVTWTYIRTIRSATNAIRFPKPLAVSALRIKATGQLQGVVDNLNATLTSYAPVWDGTSWGDEEPTQNNAALMRLVLTGPANPKPRPVSKIDDASLGEFYEHCATNGWQFNMVRDYAAGVWDVCSDICSAARAAPTILDGKWGVIIDKPNKPVAQRVTPRNSWEFKGKKVFINPPHALRVKFADEDNGFENDEVIVYADGYDDTTATLFESLEFPGVTKSSLNWKLGRYQMAQVKLRPQVYTFNLDFEHLRCRRGDLIYAGHDVPMWGSGQARVKSLVISEDQITAAVLDDKVIMTEGRSYGCRFWLDDGSNIVVGIETDSGETNTLRFKSPIATTQNLNVGDMGMFGEMGREYTPLLVKAIRPAADLTAAFECVDFAPQIYDADTGDIPAFNPNITAPTSPARIAPNAPKIVAVESGTAALEKTASGIKSRIFVSIEATPSSVRVDQFTVRYCLSGSTDWRFVTQTSLQTVVVLPDVIDGETYNIQAQASSIYGTPSAWSPVVTEKVIGQSERPTNVTNFKIEIRDGIAYASWDARNEIDHSHVQIRRNARTTGALWDGSVIAVEKATGTMASMQALDGTYLVKAYDVSGNESEIAATFVNNETRLANLTYVDEISQSTPNWIGSGTGVEYSTTHGGLVLQGGVYEGTYEISNIVDLTNIFTALVTASIASTSVNLTSDLYNESDLYAAGDLYGVTPGQTTVSVEMASTETTLGALSWSDYETFQIGEYSKRGYKIRLRLKRALLSITPVVQAVKLTVHMKIRSEPFRQEIPVGGARVSVADEFYAAPEIAFSIFNGQEGDRYTITNVTTSGFNINFTNGGVNVGPRTISGTMASYGVKIE